MVGIQNPQFDIGVCRYVNPSLLELQPIDLHHSFPVHCNISFLGLKDRPLQFSILQLFVGSDFQLRRVYLFGSKE